MQDRSGFQNRIVGGDSCRRNVAESRTIGDRSRLLQSKLGPGEGTPCRRRGLRRIRFFITIIAASCLISRGKHRGIRK